MNRQTQDKARQGKTRQGKARQLKYQARQGEAKQGKAITRQSQDKAIPSNIEHQTRDEKQPLKW
jgi:hypothetical protein